MGNLEVKKGERESLQGHLLERTRRGLSTSDTNFSLELPGSPRINEKEGGMRTEKSRSQRENGGNRASEQKTTSAWNYRIAMFF
ncbi:hypothetical protein TNCV_3537081 [Trichonephila clavipes]|uniref:Uncharacterized protein n=1 Tax=Trichonephila clavipes TaxID=2585209 RepID=A0A8X7BAI9_TRICX|nr:hypothetical protein TNCV_3537081 [Trichonephila clavipes]